MNKAFVRESDQPDDGDDDVTLSPLPPGGKNYMTPGGYARLASEYRWLLDQERPGVTATVFSSPMRLAKRTVAPKKTR